MGRYVIITINALKHINLIGQAIFIVTLRHRDLGRPEEMIRHDQRTGAAIYIARFLQSDYILYNDY